MELDDGGHRRAGGEELAHRGAPLAHRAVDRRGDDGVHELLARQLELGSALEQHGLSIAHLLDRVLVAPLRHRQPRDGGVELGLGDQSLLLEALRAFARELGLVEHGARLLDEGGLLDVHAVVGALGRQPEPGARLLQRGHGLIDAEPGVGGIEARHDLAALEPAAQVHGQLGHTPGHLGAQHHLLVGGQGPRRADPLVGRLLRRGGHFHRPGLGRARPRGGRSGGLAGGILTAEQRQGRADERQAEVAEAEQARERHQSHPTWPASRRPKPGVPWHRVARVGDRDHSHQAWSDGSSTVCPVALERSAAIRISCTSRPTSGLQRPSIGRPSRRRERK